MKKPNCFNHMGGRCKKGADSREWAHRPTDEEGKERKAQAGGKRRALDEV